MVALRLEDDALAWMGEKLMEAGGGLAAGIRKEDLREPVVFVPDFADPLTLPELDYGGVANQEGANAEFVSFLHFLKQRNPKLESLILDDPWAEARDMDYAGPPPEELISIDGKLGYVQEMSALTPDLIWQYRAIAVGFLKIIYVSELSAEEIRRICDIAPDDIVEMLAPSVRYIAVNAYDDESWLIVRHDI